MNIVIIDRGKPIPAKKYGGTERVIWALGFCLSKLNHNVTYIVPKGSKCDFAKIIEYNPTVNINDLIPEDSDLIHLHFQPNMPINFPHVITMHGYLKSSEINLNTIFVSKKHAELHNSTVFVYNGLLWSDYQPVNFDIKRHGFHFLGKADWKIKNVKDAIKIALANNKTITILGGKRFSFKSIKRSFFNAINPKVKFKGMVGGKKKFDLLNQSKGLIFPVKWHEPFGLAIIESLYYGCPVFATKNGAISEIINPEIGYLSNSLSKLKKAITLADRFDPMKCHQYAKNNFSAMDMTKNYLKYYSKVLNGEKLNLKLLKQNTEDGISIQLNLSK